MLDVAIWEQENTMTAVGDRLRLKEQDMKDLLGENTEVWRTITLKLVEVRKSASKNIHDNHKVKLRALLSRANISIPA